MTDLRYFKTTIRAIVSMLSEYHQRENSAASRNYAENGGWLETSWENDPPTMV